FRRRFVDRQPGTGSPLMLVRLAQRIFRSPPAPQPKRRVRRRSVPTLFRPSLEGLEERLAPAISITPTSLPHWTVNKAYSQTLGVNGNEVQPVTFSVTVGALPSGLTLSSTGPATAAISGTPDTAGGPITFTVHAVDSKTNPGAQTADQSYTIT